MSEKEIWKPICSSLKLSRYAISNRGRVKNIGSGYILNCPLIKTGYVLAVLKGDEGKKSVQVHVLVATTFIPKPENYELGGYTVDHINRDRSDNRVENLRWATGREQNLNSGPGRGGKGKITIQYDGNMKKIKEWPSASAAERALDLIPNSVSATCRGSQKTAGGWIWRYKSAQTIEGEEWLYDEEFNLHVSNKGRIKTPKGTIMKGYKVNTTGHYCIPSFRIGDKNRTYVHILVAKLFIPNPKNKPYVCHRDKVMSNNEVSNLRWCTAKESGKLHSATSTKPRISIGRPVRQYSLDGEFIKEFDSMNSAAKVVGTSRDSVFRVCSGITSSTSGYVFKFSNATDTIKRTKKKVVPIYLLLKGGKKRLYEGGAPEAALELKLHTANIHKVCKGERKATGGYSFEYV